MSGNIKLWSPSEKRIQEANITRFQSFVEEKTGKSFTDYNQFYNWSIEYIPDFWETVWQYGDIINSRGYDRVVNHLDMMPGCKWFEGARLNFAENLLRYRDDHTALLFKGEGRELRSITYRELYGQVARLNRSLMGMGIEAGDRVAGFMPNMIETVVAMLAATSLGAIWSSCSPDFGVQGALDRFGQISPRIIFTTDGYYYNGKRFDTLPKVQHMAEQIPSLQKVVVVSYTGAETDLSGLPDPVFYEDFLGPDDSPALTFEQLPFDHPVYIMYSSGTTGAPKCIVHGAGGTLIQHIKELAIHTDVKRDDIIFYATTCGWMMWNWLVSSLTLGATVLLYDGSVFYPEPGALFELAEETGMTMFGTSARYLLSLEQSGCKPGESYNLKHLKSILSTGSPLVPESFDYVYRDIKKDLCLSSVSGGTDIISCFALGNPTLPVYRGELQCCGLGMKVAVFDENGKAVSHQKGELVCAAPFPSMPVYFWHDESDQKYRAAYFEFFPNVWRHGDYMEITETGGVIIYGRSDATLLPGGVRIGTAEIYRLVETLPEVEDSLVIGQPWLNDERIVLFLKLLPENTFNEELVGKIKKMIRENASPRHVPAIIMPIADIPYTINMKKVEIAVRKIIQGEEVKNREALANPESLDLYKNLPELQA